MRKTNKVLAITLALVLVLGICSIASATEPEQKTVEGQGDYFVTGESYPTSIQIAGYNSRDDKMYLNFDLKTTKTVEATETAKFDYSIELFNGSSGMLVATAVTSDKTGATAATTATVGNEEITLNSTPLTAAYRVVITVTSTTIALQREIMLDNFCIMY